MEKFFKIIILQYITFINPIKIILQYVIVINPTISSDVEFNKKKMSIIKWLFIYYKLSILLYKKLSSFYLVF